jgi:hypothetical protein
MEQDRPGPDEAAAEEWDKAGVKVKAEAEWADNSPQDREEAVYVQNAVKRCRILLVNRVIDRVAPNVGR